MALNPIRFTNSVNNQFLNYQLTAFPLTDPDLAAQARSLLRGPLGNSPLFKGPYVSLSKSFKLGRNLEDLADAGIVHAALPGLTEYPVLFAHQDAALQAAAEDRHCLISTGTGSGKTEAFLYPILDHCLKLRDAGAAEGIVAILVYPMNALAIDQLGRLRQMLTGSGISFGMYVGTTPADEGDLSKLGNVVRMKAGEGRSEYERRRRKHSERDDVIISPFEERLTEKEMAANPPRLLLTNANQLELLLTRGRDLGMFMNAPLKFLVFDEAHTYTGVTGAEVACLIRRLRSFCDKSPDDVICIATSATMTDPTTGADEGAQFAQRFFGVDPKRVTLVREEYQKEEFPADRNKPTPPSGDAVALLDHTLQALEAGDEPGIRQVVQELTGKPLSTRGPWPEMVYDHLKSNESVYSIYHQLDRPFHLRDAVQRVSIGAGRSGFVGGDQAEGELLCYLALGAAAEKKGNPLLRPKVHYFLRGLEGAVVAFVEKNEAETPEPRLNLSLADARREYSVEPAACLPLLVCKTCGQHYFEAYYRNFVLDAGLPSGGDAEGDNVVWEPADEVDGTRLVLTNRFVAEIDDDDSSAAEKLDRKRAQVFFCRYCGAIHRSEGSCQNVKCKRARQLVPMWCLLSAVGGKLLMCASCGQRGRQIGDRTIEPIKPLRGVTVADVHIVAQNMINSVPEGQQKLIVFSDNRQDAAFQAGWMQDHARRYRLRHLIYDYLRDKQAPESIGGIQEHMVNVFREDTNLAMALAPEVYAGRGEEAFGETLQDTLRYYIRIALLREWATGFKQRDSLETWGMSRVVYAGVEPSNGWIAQWSVRLNMDAITLTDGISALLDSFRRNRYLYDDMAPIFSRYWHESDWEVQRGFLPYLDFPPKGIKETKVEGDNPAYTTQFRSDRGQTLVQNYIGKWGLLSRIRPEFIAALWEFLTGATKTLRPINLTGNKGRVLPGAKGLFQLGSSEIGIVTQRERYRCDICQRIHTRPTPSAACTAMHCNGKTRKELPPADDYNISLLDLPFSMVTAQEHTAQVPAAVRERIEAEFKNPTGRTNCLVATPTLELGVDIGALDMILMRNVPPKPSNYWQRAGRAGRRHRMAVIYTYCRRSNHDSYFFEDPARMLDGPIDAPRFNLRNDVMLRKHVHAAMLSEMIRIERSQPGPGISQHDIDEVNRIRHEVFPDYIERYLFNPEKEYLSGPYDVSLLAIFVSGHRERLLGAVRRIFSAYWPEEDLDAVSDVILARYLDQAFESLQEVVDALFRRMAWSVITQNRLLAAQQRGLLDPEEERLLARCRRYLHGLAAREMGTYTLSVLASEGFLPGYGTYVGGITAFASRALRAGDAREFTISRAPSIAIREFVPGNLIYANSGRFKVSLLHFPIGEGSSIPEDYNIDIERERIAEARAAQSAQYGGAIGAVLTGLPICDADITYVSRISDDEQNRFQVPVTILGYLKNAHSGGAAYSVAGKTIQHRFGQRTRLVNIGPADLVKRGLLGYPICTVCGGARSPYASDRDIDNFIKIHQERCGRKPFRIALSADARVDGLLLSGFQAKADAINLAESIRIGAAQLLEMSIDDLQILSCPQADETFDVFLYDPMPGGSGLLQQILDRWQQIIDAAAEVLASCPQQCEASCYDCMRTYRNVFYHGLLDRHKASKLIGEYTGDLKREHDMPAVEEAEPLPQGLPTNQGEHDLAATLDHAGFPPFDHQFKIEIGPPFGTTTPDLYHYDPTTGVRLAVYLDGLSKGVHGGAERTRIDRMIRETLEADGVDVVEIASSDLTDPEAMRRHLKRIAVKLRRADIPNL
jgi:ATP-dependent helicase YprA (DUF1998 family)